MAGESSHPPGTAPPIDEAGSYPFLVAAVGASAGGLEALKAFFEPLPDDSGVSFVVGNTCHPTTKA